MAQKNTMKLLIAIAIVSYCIAMLSKQASADDVNTSIFLRPKKFDNVKPLANPKILQMPFEKVKDNVSDVDVHRKTVNIRSGKNGAATKKDKSEKKKGDTDKKDKTAKKSRKSKKGRSAKKKQSRNDKYINKCLTAFARSGFTVSDLDKYHLWFDEDSVMTLAQTGTYTGIDAIKEYVNFLYYPKYWEYSKFMNTTIFPVMARKNKCVVAGAVLYKRRVNQEIAGSDSVLSTLSGSLLTFKVIDDEWSQILVDSWKVYYPDEFLGVNYSSSHLLTKNTMQIVCEIMKKDCADVWDFNKLMTIEECTSKLMELPTTEGPLGAIDGKSYGCRVLHAAFSSTNSQHCPHISFKPLADYKGVIKCQETEGLSPEDLFPREVLDYFYKQGQAWGLGDKLFFVE